MSMLADASSCASSVDSDGSQSPRHSTENRRVSLTFSLERPGALPALLAGCGVQQATHIRGNACAVLWDRIAVSTQPRPSPRISTDATVQAPNHRSARAVPHRCVPTRVLETAVAPFLDVLLPAIGVCPIPVALPHSSNAEADATSGPVDTKDDSGSNDSPTTAYVFVEQFQGGAAMLLPRVIILPPSALCATEAGGRDGEHCRWNLSDCRVPCINDWCLRQNSKAAPGDDEHKDGSGTTNEGEECGVGAAGSCTATPPLSDPWERFATTAVVRTTGKAFETVSIPAEEVADTLSKISMAAPFVEKLDFTDAVADVTGDLCLPEATVARLGSVTAVDCRTVALPFLRSLLLQLNNDRRFSGVSADGAVAALPRKQRGTQVESLDVFTVDDYSNIADKEVHDDYRNLTELRCFSSDVLLYFLRSARRSLHTLALGFGDSSFDDFMTAARSEGLVSDAVGPNGAMVESIGQLLPCLTAATFIECTVEKGAFASLVGHKISNLSVDDCTADGDDFLELCRHPSRPTAQCRRLDFRTASFPRDVVAAAMEFFPSLTSYSCASGTNYGALLSIAEKRHCESLSVIGTPDGATPEEVADVITEIVHQPRVRSANLVNIPGIDVARVTKMREGGRCSLRILDCAPLCVDHEERVTLHRPALLALLPRIRYDQSACRLVLPDGAAEVLSAIDTPIPFPDGECDVSGDIFFVAAHALPTQHLPPPCTIEFQGSGTASTQTFVPPSGEASPEPTPKLSNITPVVYGGIDLPTALPHAVRIATGQLPLLRTVDLGGPAAVLLSVMDHCPLLQEITWVLDSSSGDDPLRLWGFGGPARSQPSVPANVHSAVRWVGTAEAAFRPTCFQTLTTLTLDYRQSEERQGGGSDHGEGSDSDDHADGESNTSAADDGAESSEDGDSAADEAEANDDEEDTPGSDDCCPGDDSDREDYGESDGGASFSYSPLDDQRAVFRKYKTFAAACALFVKACPALTKLSLENTSMKYDVFNVVQEFVAATMKAGRCCEVSQW